MTRRALLRSAAALAVPPWAAGPAVILARTTSFGIPAARGDTPGRASVRLCRNGMYEVADNPYSTPIGPYRLVPLRRLGDRLVVQVELA